MHTNREAGAWGATVQKPGQWGTPSDLVSTKCIHLSQSGAVGSEPTAKIRVGSWWSRVLVPVPSSLFSSLLPKYQTCSHHHR